MAMELKDLMLTGEAKEKADQRYKEKCLKRAPNKVVSAIDMAIKHDEMMRSCLQPMGAYGDTLTAVERSCLQLMGAYQSYMPKELNLVPTWLSVVDELRATEQRLIPDFIRTIDEQKAAEQRQRDIERERQNEEFRATNERLANAQRQHKQMLIDVQVEAMRIIEAEKKTIKSKTSDTKKAGDANRKRSEHVIDWVTRTEYVGNKVDKAINSELQVERPELWGDNLDTFKKWIQSEEATEAKKLLPNRRR